MLHSTAKINKYINQSINQSNPRIKERGQKKQEDRFYFTFVHHRSDRVFCRGGSSFVKAQVTSTEAGRPTSTKINTTIAPLKAMVGKSKVPWKSTELVSSQHLYLLLINRELPADCILPRSDTNICGLTSAPCEKVTFFS